MKKILYLLSIFIFLHSCESIRVTSDFDENYTLHSCRAYYINKRLALGVSPVIVAELVGHSIKTMERHYKRIRLRQLESEVVNVRRKQLEDNEFQTFDLD